MARCSTTPPIDQLFVKDRRPGSINLKCRLRATSQMLSNISQSPLCVIPFIHNITTKHCTYVNNINKALWLTFVQILQYFVISYNSKLFVHKMTTKVKSNQPQALSTTREAPTEQTATKRAPRDR